MTALNTSQIPLENYTPLEKNTATTVLPKSSTSASLGLAVVMTTPGNFHRFGRLHSTLSKTSSSEL
jgi:hypothetical protein